MSGLHKRRCAVARGIATVELVLLLVPLLLVVGGVLDAGYVLKRSNLALLASRSGARAESGMFHNLTSGAPAPPFPCSELCSQNCPQPEPQTDPETRTLDTAHDSACSYLQNELGSAYNAEDWMVTSVASGPLHVALEQAAPTSQSDPVIKTVRVTVALAPGKRACLTCLFGQFSNIGVAGESTYFMRQ